MTRGGRFVLGSKGLSCFLQGRPNTFLVRWLPLCLSRAYLGLLGRLYYALNRHERELIRANLDAVLRRIPAGAPLDPVACQAFQGIFAHYSEKLITAYARAEKVYRFVEERVEFQAENLLVEAFSRGRGVILVTSHFGGVEFMPVILARKGYPVTMVVRFKTERLKRALVPRGEVLGITLLDAGGGNGVLFTALDSLKANQILITECDEFEGWRPTPKRSAQFLGYSCPMDRTLGLLHRRSRAPVLMALNRRVTASRYQLKFHDLNAPEPGLESEDIQQRALRMLEQYICDAPGQWYQWKNLRTIFGSQLFGSETEEPCFTVETGGLPAATGSAWGS